MRAGALHGDNPRSRRLSVPLPDVPARNGSISIALKNVKQSEITWDHEPDWFDSSPIAERPYCRECGTSLGFRFKDGSENMDLTVASFDDPSPFRPEASFRRREHAPAWLNTEGIEEVRTGNYQKLVDKWVQATGQFPG